MFPFNFAGSIIHKKLESLETEANRMVGFIPTLSFPCTFFFSLFTPICRIGLINYTRKYTTKRDVFHSSVGD
uniref:Uncharacterized protein n=1 Tax=Rhizophora mucronata TaxID=61149 RepID=A0A2P2JTY2_RHIMU